MERTTAVADPERDPGARVFASLAEAVLRARVWMPRGVADMHLAVPVHGRGAYYTPLYRSQRSNYLGR